MPRKYQRGMVNPKAKGSMRWYTKEKLLTARLKQKFGLSIERFNEMLIEQNGVCAICKEKNFGDLRLAVDHDHITKQVRSLLCTACNGMLGLAKDRPGILRLGADYLEKWGRY
jgi:hypothetical protein